ncbi:flocculation protein FLO11-like [Cucumis melo var. makuwa]|uniref:Flocculation protein FLO11-like n=1 Tax=Cucumis melo var. makuwa TaxID=1194695 RepID=A0A5A7TWY4_CUCMM|nr:flocculation protein FLO11-like [Cucumis melo var. makuwa]
MNSTDISYQTHHTNLPTSKRCLPIDPSVTSTIHDSNTKLLAPSAHVKKNNPVSNLIGEIDRGIITRKKTRQDYANMIAKVCFSSTIEPSNIREALQENQWIEAMQEELHQFERNQVGYYDVGWAGYADNRKNTSVGCFLVGNNLIAWFSKTYNYISLSTDEELSDSSSAVSSVLHRSRPVSKQIAQKDLPHSVPPTIEEEVFRSRKRKSKTPNKPVEHVVVEFNFDDDVALADVMCQKFIKGKAPQTYCHVDEVIDDLFREFGTQPTHMASPSRHPSISPSHCRPSPPSSARNTEASRVQNVEALVVPPPVDTEQNMGTSGIHPLAPIQHGFRPPSQGQRVISTKAGRRKLHLNVPSMPIDRISFHSKKCVFWWKYVMKLWIADEPIVYDQLHSYATVIDLIAKARLMCTVNNLGIFYLKLVREFIVNFPTYFNEPSTPDFQKLTTEQHALELSSGLVRNWPIDGQFLVTKLSVKYAILHKISIANWYPSKHLGTFSTELAFLLSHHPNLLTNDDVVGSTPRTISLSYKTFQRAHVSDLPTMFRPPRRSVESSKAELPVPDDGLHLSRDLVLQGAIFALTGRRTVVDSLLHVLHTLLTSSQTFTNPSAVFVLMQGGVV